MNNYFDKFPKKLFAVYQRDKRIKVIFIILAINVVLVIFCLFYLIKFNLQVFGLFLSQTGTIGLIYESYIGKYSYSKRHYSYHSYSIKEYKGIGFSSSDFTNEHARVIFWLSLIIIGFFIQVYYIS
jgi:hypothetical protein